jgi:uncharacterized membrane protein
VGAVDHRHPDRRYLQRWRGLTPAIAVVQFQVSITNLFMSSLILTGMVQLAYTRYIADQLFAKRVDLVTPTFNGL